MSMIENAVEQYDRFQSRSRFEWYQARKLIGSINMSASETCHDSVSFIQIGGTAIFIRAFNSFGPLAVWHFRGTHDMDALSFLNGSARRILDHAVEKSDILESYSESASSNLLNKKTFTMQLALGNGLHSTNKFELDVIEASADRTIPFNNRLFTADRLIFDPPELCTLNSPDIRAVTPSIRDLFVMKMDVAIPENSKCGLRIKDALDVLMLVRICEAEGVDCWSLMSALIEDKQRKESAIESDKSLPYPNKNKKLGLLRRNLACQTAALAEILVIPDCLARRVPDGYPFFPVNGAQKQALEAAKYAKRLAGIKA